MTDKKFVAEYKKHIESAELPVYYQAEILSNLKSKSATSENFNLHTNRRIAVSLAAALVVMVFGLSACFFFGFFGSRDVNFKFRVMSATNLSSISGAKIMFRTPSGEKLKDKNGKELAAYTDEKGFAKITLPSSESYTAEVQAEGYITLEEAAKDGNYYISPVMDENTYRAVLTWDKECDLDAVLSVTQGENTEVVNYYKSDIKDESGRVLAALDVDNEIGDGPETITFNANENSRYLFSVLSYSSLKESENLSFSDAKAKVTLYKEDKMVKVFTFDGHSTGNVWCVFRLENGNLDVCNYAYSVNAATEVQ